ncbi:MAG: hypothetical protein CM1200mP3_11080 [Chloroflexota bacterium]|nr:MAG: hypothetical protein CM1200mP3_11080 [Chloroflexota bacterium]
MRLTEAVNMPKYDTFSKQLRMQYMGQTLSNPPSVEGWDGGTTWIDTGALVERMNFAAEELGSVTTPDPSSCSTELYLKTQPKFPLRELLIFVWTTLDRYQYIRIPVKAY